MGSKFESESAIGKAAGAVGRKRLKNNLNRCLETSDVLGLTAIAIYVQRALDELTDEMAEEMATAPE